MAAAQSAYKNSFIPSIFLSPQMTMAPAADSSIAACEFCEASSARSCLFLITMKWQGCLFFAVGAYIPQQSIVVTISSPTGLEANFRMLCRVLIAASTSIPLLTATGSSRFLPAGSSSSEDMVTCAFMVCPSNPRDFCNALSKTIRNFPPPRDNNLLRYGVPLIVPLT